MLEDCGGELQEFVSTCKGVFSSLVEKHFPVPNKKNKTIDIIGEMMSHSRWVLAGVLPFLSPKQTHISPEHVFPFNFLLPPTFLIPSL